MYTKLVNRVAKRLSCQSQIVDSHIYGHNQLIAIMPHKGDEWTMTHDALLNGHTIGRDYASADGTGVVKYMTIDRAKRLVSEYREWLELNPNKSHKENLAAKYNGLAYEVNERLMTCTGYFVESPIRNHAVMFKIRPQGFFRTQMQEEMERLSLENYTIGNPVDNAYFMSIEQMKSFLSHLLKMRGEK